MSQKEIEDHLDYLEETNRFTVDALEMAASLGDFHSSLDKLQDPDAIFRETAPRVKRLLPFQAVSFYLVDEASSDIKLVHCDPPSETDAVKEQVEFLIGNGSFAWALREHRAVTVFSKDFRKQVLLHVMATHTYIRGMFVGILNPREKNVPGVSISLLSIILLNSANTLESFELYRMVQRARDELENRVVERTRELTEINRKLQLEIAERERAETTLLQSEEKFRELYDHAPVGYHEYDAEGRITNVNRTELEMLNYTAEEMIGQPVWKLFDEEIISRERVLSRLAGTLPPDENVQHNFRKKDGTIVPVLIMDRLILDEQGERKGIRCAIQDITQLKQAEGEKAYLLEQLHQAQKMEAIGTLAGGIAHDFNNILTAISGYAELANLDLPDDSKTKYKVQQAIQASHRAKNLVQQILAFSRQGKQERRPLNIEPIIKEALKFLRASLPATIEIRQNIEEDWGTIEADPTEVHQVMMNLCTNAAHAMDQNGGVLEVSLSKVDMPGGSPARSRGIEPGPYMRLRVSDTGRGMPPEILKKIFDPYFTTKEVGKGTGLGLSVVHGIIKSYGGGITVSSQVGRGSTFDIYFPRVQAMDRRLAAEKPQAIPFGNHERVLFVDDEKAIVEIVENMLTYLGYEIEVRTSSIEALELFRVQANRFDLVVTDMTMPNMTGDKLAQELLRIRPGVPIILCTGFSEYVTEEKAKAIGVREFVMKPLVIGDLAVSMRRALDYQKKKKD